MIRVAAVGDLHVGEDSRGLLRPHFERLPDEADVLVLAGDLTRVGTIDEARVLAGELSGIDVPKVAVLGNHDHHADEQDGVVRVLEDAGVQVIEGTAVTIDVGGARLGIAGIKGFGGGFAGACGSDFGEIEMKRFIWHTKAVASSLHEALASLAGGDHPADVRVALLHYAPVKETLVGEKLEIYPFLGSYLLGEAVDRAGADLVVHGHAHRGTEVGITPGGIHVRNVAMPVLQHPYRVYRLGPPDTAAGTGRSAPGRVLAAG